MSQLKVGGGEVAIYKHLRGRSSFVVRLCEDTVWLNLDQMASLFDRDKSVISRHIKNIFNEKELSPKSVVANFATTAADGKVYQVDYYNLDIIISVGYRVKSQNGVRFRMWATKVLKDHLIRGYTLNQKRLKELKRRQLKDFEDAVGLIRQAITSRQLSGSEEKGLLYVITEYAHTWALLNKYDKNDLSLPGGTQRPVYEMDYTIVQESIDCLKNSLISKGEASDFFGRERSGGLNGIIRGIYQTFDDRELYPSIEEKAAHLLYFIIKDHPFTDGNKRIAALVFILFLSRNRYLVRDNGDKKINDNALVAIALLIAESKPSQKDVMISLIMHFLVSHAE